MAWTKTSPNEGTLFATETYTAPASATIGYSSEIDWIFNNGLAAHYVQLTFAASAVTGTNFDIALYGANSTGGTKFLLKDAIVADITDTTLAIAVVDFNLYPAPYYYLAWTADVDESANTITATVSLPT